MGANYDLIIAHSAHFGLLERVNTFLLENGLRRKSTCLLRDTDLDDDNAILLGPETNGRVQVVALPSSLRIPLETWFGCNPLALRLSVGAEWCVHLWSFDSGYAAGYSVYVDGELVETECMFSTSARGHDELTHGIALPKPKPGDVLQRILGRNSDIRQEMKRFKNLELSVAWLVSNFGFSAHLVDFHEAIDEMLAIAVDGPTYAAVDILDWNVILFGS